MKELQLLSILTTKSYLNNKELQQLLNNSMEAEPVKEIFKAWIRRTENNKQGCTYTGIGIGIPMV